MNHMETLSTAVVICALIKFLAEGVSFVAHGVPINFGHIDGSTYLALLTPVLAAHGYIKVNGDKGGSS